MKVFLKNNLALCLAMVPFFLAAQTSLGLRSGVSVSTWQIKGDGTPSVIDPEYRPGFDIAAVAEFGIPEFLALQTELGFLQKGYKFNVKLPQGEADFNYIYNYLELNVLGKIIIGSDKVNGFVLVGPTLGYAASAKEIREENGEKTTDKIDFDDQEIKRIDFGLTGGGGIAFSLWGGKLFLDGRYLFGLTNLNDSVNADDIKWKNRGFNASVGFLYSLAKEPKTKTR